ncbi:MAG TPA: hypothetical protein VI461_04555 [Chitinophagaceae bacterium]|nr:hypothetical protein [Chitinophagaceae bacterium]
MKKILFTCFTSMLLIWTITNSYAQSPNSTAKLESSQGKFISSSEEIIPVQEPASARLNELNTKAVRSFTKDYKNVTEAKWSRLNKGFSIVYFTVDNIQTSVLYNKSGMCEWVRRDYSEDNLPRNVRHLVKSTYYDFSIYCVNEITIDDTTAYILAMEDKTSKDKISWKIIKIVDGEMEIIKEYSQKINDED